MMFDNGYIPKFTKNLSEQARRLWYIGCVISIIVLDMLSLFFFNDFIKIILTIISLVINTGLYICCHKTNSHKKEIFWFFISIFISLIMGVILHKYVVPVGEWPYNS